VPLPQRRGGSPRDHHSGYDLMGFLRRKRHHLGDKGLMPRSGARAAVALAPALSLLILCRCAAPSPAGRNHRRRRIEMLPGLGLFRFLRSGTGAKQMTKRRQNLDMIAHDFRDRQQRRREQRAWYAPQPVPEHSDDITITGLSVKRRASSIGVMVSPSRMCIPR
jgi:hypothetical protein